ncbi:PAQR family membrane homeostasis protein TrhA [Exiguobacterium flavidum]|uniref:PAQR family membrane homeostasis protein TrhA n=1 Tax=Exiguobacterium flavidum TaxID=2184695 RepID=UPI000DF7EFD8|nr:hemolysin III family protein [Exiguobacterium flavidum]
MANQTLKESVKEHAKETLDELLAKGDTLKEEIASAITHGLGLIFSITALVLLVVAAVDSGSAWNVTAVSIFGATMILLYLFSTLMHSLMFTPAKRVLQILDHAGIYLLIAGSYTPFALVTLRGPLGWTLLGIVWGVGILGIIWKLFSAGKYVWISNVSYLVLGWCCLFAIKPLYLELGLQGFLLLLGGGLAYSLGVIFYVWAKLPYNHAIWHLFVLAGSVLIFLSIFLYVAPNAMS